jgi:hypothetical protein
MGCRRVSGRRWCVGVPHGCGRGRPIGRGDQRGRGPAFGRRPRPARSPSAGPRRRTVAASVPGTVGAQGAGGARGRPRGEGDGEGLGPRGRTGSPPTQRAHRRTPRQVGLVHYYRRGASGGHGASSAGSGGVRGVTRSEGEGAILPAGFFGALPTITRFRPCLRLLDCEGFQDRPPRHR